MKTVRQNLKNLAASGVLVSLFFSTALVITFVPAGLVSAATNYCPALAAPSGTVVNVSNFSQLSNAVASAGSGTTIMVADGTYNVTSDLAFNNSGVTMRSASGNRDAVILDGNYVAQELLRIYAANVTVADMTIKESYYHPIHVTGAASNVKLYNLKIQDGREQFLKINQNGTQYPDNGTLACSSMELTDAGRNYIFNNPTPGFTCYTGGLDAHQTQGWIIRDNVIKNIYCTNGLAEHGIHMWNTNRDTIVERNVLINNARGIGFGLGNSGGARIFPDNPLAGSGFTAQQVVHIGGEIRNNFVYANIPYFDTGIGLESAWNVKVYHNTVLSTQGGLGLDVRFAPSNGDLRNNLLSTGISFRDGAVAKVNSGNVTTANANMFVGASSGNLHLLSTATAAINKGVSLSGALPQDIDGDARDSQPDVGADEYLSGATPPPPPQTLVGDINKDGIVNSLDWSAMNSKWFTSDTNSDLNKDGIVNSLDFSLLNANWFKTS